MSDDGASPWRTFREVLRWCLPALIVGFVLRALMVWAMPLAYVQHDSMRLLVSGAERLPEDQFETMTNNVPFLVPALYRLALLLPGPGLIAIELGQHLVGLVQIVISGLLVRAWFRRWKWWIIPSTLIFAVHPAFLWYEHTVMLETMYGFSVMTLALAGTWFFRRPSVTGLAAIGASAWFVAATRPEGKLFVLFAILALVAGFYGRWREMAKGAVICALTLIAVAMVSVKGESGMLLYSSVIHLSPLTSSRYPEVAPYVAKLRNDAVERASRGPAFVSRSQRVALTAAMKQYVKDYPGAGRGASDEQRMNSVAQALAKEACQQDPWSLVPLSVLKFRASADELVNGRLSKIWLHDRQISRLRNSWATMRAIHRGLYGREFAKPTEFDDYIPTVFHESRLGWFEWWSDQWEQIYTRHFPDTRYPSMRLPGLPYFYVLPLLGMLLSIVLRTSVRRFHWCWVLTLSAIWFIVMVTANERSRFRFMFESFTFLYAVAPIALLTDLSSRGSAADPELTPEPQSVT